MRGELPKAWRAITKVVEQRGGHDCGVAALAMMLVLPYEWVYSAAQAVLGHPVDYNGISGEKLIAAAAHLDRHLKAVPTNRYPLCNGLRAVIRVRFNYTESRNHWVMVDEGMVFETDGTVWKVESYLIDKDARFCSAYVGEGVVFV